MSKQLPKAVNQFRKRHPKVWKAFNELGERCHEAGPIGGGLEGVTHSAVRNARKAGITPEEIDHVAVLAISTLGLPAATRAMTWIADNPRRAR